MNRKNTTEQMLGLSGQFWDKAGNHLFKAFLGWGDPVWAGIAADTLASTVAQLQPFKWTTTTIKVSEEGALAKYLERKFKANGLKPRFLSVRAKVGHQIQTRVFVHGLEVGELNHYNFQTIKSAGELSALLKGLLSYKRHPTAKNIRRFSISRALGHDLRLSRVRTLVEKARASEDHVLYELPNQADFMTRMTAFLKADVPLLNITDKKKIELLRETGAISEAEIQIIDKRLLSSKGKWSPALIYKGTPGQGAAMDTADGRFAIVVNNRYAAMSVWIDPPTKEKLAWELINDPSGYEDINGD